MPKHKITFIELHNPLFMNGTNMGSKLSTDVRPGTTAKAGVKMILDDERQAVWVHYNKRTAFIPLPSVASCDILEVPGDVLELLGLTPMAEEIISGPPAVMRARRGRPPSVQPTEEIQAAPTEVPYPDFDPNDEDAAARHRELVRAASANSNKAPFKGPQNDSLIQSARNAAMSIKTHGTAQVQNAQQVGELAAVTGKPKALSHAGMRAQVAKEMKE